jgi:hypothetical protein
MREKAVMKDRQARMVRLAQRGRQAKKCPEVWEVLEK